MNTKNGINKVFSISPSHYKQESLCVYVNRVKIEDYENAEDDQTITLANAPNEDDVITISYFDSNDHLKCISF